MPDRPTHDTAAAVARLTSRARREVHGRPGQQVVWRRFGAGPPLVLLHGGHGSWLHWARNIEALSAQHEVLVPDMPGFGESDDLTGSPHASDRLERLVETLQSTLGELLAKPGAIDLAGFSFGGLVAARLAEASAVDANLAATSRHPVRRMALIGPAGHGQRRRVSVGLQDWRLSDPAARLAALRQNLESFMLHRTVSADALALHIHEYSCLATRFRSKALSMRTELWPALKCWGGPLLTLWGEHDVTCAPQELGPLFPERQPGAQWQVLRQAGHWLAYEEAAAVNRRLLEWFEPGQVVSVEPSEKQNR